MKGAFFIPFGFLTEQIKGQYDFDVGGASFAQLGAVLLLAWVSVLRRYLCPINPVL